ncbi:MAG: type II toxin-antitoxin system PemK/MazF family toxin [Anaerolineae bacterium]|nr:type II toxin-antitoxin system PemK/MazF family toxin [Anaerolineae bacterium]
MGDENAANDRVIQQGEIYWVQLDTLDGLDAGIPHPHLVIQDNVLNHSRIPTVVVCGLTTNQNRANLPGSIVLEAGEANLPKRSIIEVSKVSSISKARLGEYIGTLSEQRVQQVLAAMRFLQRSFFSRFS